MRERLTIIAALLACVSAAQAININMVTVGNPGNEPDTRYATPGYGSVGRTYTIGKYKVTAGQYAEFLNAVAKTDTYGLYNTKMADAVGSLGCNIQRSGSSDNYSYSVNDDWANRPVNYVSWGDAARFANWMRNGRPTGAQNLSTTEDGSYYLNGATSHAALLAVTRKANATWVIPNEDEWYKAAYHKNDGVTGNYWDYPTSSDTINTGMANYGMSVGHTTDVGTYSIYHSPYGTFDQGGNVWEWNETAVNGSYRGLRGGSFASLDTYLGAASRDGHSLRPASEGHDVGFRVAEIPEPATLGLMVMGAWAAFGRKRA